MRDQRSKWGITDATGRGFLGVSGEQGHMLQKSREMWVKKRHGILKIGNNWEQMREMFWISRWKKIIR